MIRFGLVWLFLQQFIVEFFLLFFERLDAWNSLALGYLEVGVFFLEFEQLLETVGKVTLVFEVDLGELLETVEAKELGDFFEPLLSYRQKLI
jgi:hypothetical protein